MSIVVKRRMGVGPTKKGWLKTVHRIDAMHGRPYHDILRRK
jgi:hypothetical protein